MITSSQYNEFGEKAPNSALLSEDVFHNILENSFAVLIGQKEVHCELEKIWDLHILLVYF